MQTISLDNEYVQMSVDAGVPPLELRFFPIVDIDTGFPIAYRTKTTIRSIKMGHLEEEAYTYVSDRRPCGEELLRHNIQHAITALKKFDEADRDVQFVTVRCPSELVESADLYEIMAEVLQKNPKLDPQRLCLEFPASLVIFRQEEKAHKAVLDMKLLHVRSALVGCGEEDFPMAKLLTVTPDIVFLSEKATGWAGSRDKPRLFNSLISYINSMSVGVVAEGTEEQRKLLRGSDCLGFLPNQTASLSLEEAVAQKEEEEE